MSSHPAPKLTYTALVGRLLQHYRQQIGLHQADVAVALGILQPAYSRIERGDSAITVAQLRVVAHRLGMDPADIIGEAERWAQNLRQQGVTVTDETGVPKTALIVGLAILAAALFATSGS